MNRIQLLTLAAIFTMCSPAKQETTTADSTIVQQQDTITTEQTASEATEEQTSAPTLTSKSFEEIPVELQEFLNAVQDPSKLANYINATVGCYTIEEGPGVYPIVSGVKTKDDFSKNAAFSLFMNTPQLRNGYYINNEGVDPCSLPAEGIFFSTAKKDGHLLLSAYQSHLTAADEEMTEALKTKLNTLDAALIWYGGINLPGKDGELNTFDVYLALINDKVCLAAIDTRGCGI